MKHQLHLCILAALLGYFLAGCCLTSLFCGVITQAAQGKPFTTAANYTGSNGKSPLFAALLAGHRRNLMARPQPEEHTDMARY